MLKRGEGLRECEKAFDRLINGKPHVQAHVGLGPGDVTPAVVSVEAGFDRGYLKSGREAHKPLIARINSNRASSSAGGDSNLRAEKNRLERKLHLLATDSERTKKVMEATLTQNLLLVERVRELEVELSKIGGTRVRHLTGSSPLASRIQAANGAKDRRSDE